VQGKGQKKFIRTTGSNNRFEQSAIASTFVSRDSAPVEGRRIFQSTILAATEDFSHYQAAFYSMPVPSFLLSFLSFLKKTGTF